MIEIKNLTKIYGGVKKAVDNISFTVNDGEIFGFIGHNGAGKTTTIKCIVGILQFEEGDILINGKSIKETEIECKSLMAYVPDNPDLYENMKAIDFINFICDMYDTSPEERKINIHKYSEMFGLESNLNEEISSFSHGMKQKVALIAALVHDPSVIIMDEPFVGLDPKASHLLKDMMRSFCNQGGAIFFSTHVLEVAEKICDRVAIIKQGRLVVCGDMEEITHDESLESVFLELVDDENAN